MDRLDDSFVRRGDERRTTMDNSADMMAGWLAKVSTSRLWRQVGFSRGDGDLAGGTDRELRWQDRTRAL